MVALSLEEFKRLYFEEKLSIREVAFRLGVKHTTLIYRARKAGIPLRTKSSSIQLSYKEGRRDINGVNNPNYRDGKQVDGGVGKRWSKYGLTKDNFNRLLISQNNECAICAEKFDKTPHIDHCHETKKVRGLLCSSCNTGIGLFCDNAELLQRAIKYLTN